MKTQMLKLLKKPVKQKSQYPRQLVLFNKRELQILNKLKLSQRAIKNIIKMKHIFHGEIVEGSN